MSSIASTAPRPGDAGRTLVVAAEFVRECWGFICDCEAEPDANFIAADIEPEAADFEPPSFCGANLDGSFEES